VKIGIATVYQSYNCGSFFQAYALCETLKKSTDRVFFLENQIAKENKLWYRLLQCMKYVPTGKQDRARFLLNVYFNFRKARALLTTTKCPEAMDVVVYGSDTIWNIDDPYFLKNWRRFWGADFYGKKVAYAASIGSTKQERLLERDNLCKCLAEFDSIAVRDDATYDFVTSVLGSEKEVVRVIDPTLLLTPDEYEKIMPELPEQGYILFYYFGAIPEKVRESIRTYADKTGRRIVVFGEKTGWADEYVSYDPFQMLSYFKNAEYIMTNTFHGSVFSLIFNKKFVSFGKEKQKVRHLLEKFALEERLVEPGEDFLCLLNQEIDYSEVNHKIEIEREKSLSYIESVVFNKGA